MTAPKRPYRNGRVHVMADLCGSCIGRKDGIGPNLRPGRVKALVEENIAAGAAPACHSTTYGSDPRGEALCRWFVDTYTDRVDILQVAARMGIIVEQPLLPEQKENHARP